MIPLPLPKYSVCSSSTPLFIRFNPLTDTQWQLGMANGALIAVPIPAECEASGEKIQACVNQAVLESEENGISRRGKDATPWLLNRVSELSAGDSLVSNIALLKNTALIGSSSCLLEY